MKSNKKAGWSEERGGPLLEAVRNSAADYELVPDATMPVLSPSLVQALRTWYLVSSLELLLCDMRAARRDAGCSNEVQLSEASSTEMR